MPNVNNSDIGVLDEIVDPVRIPRDQAAAQFPRARRKSERHEPRGLNNAAISSADTASPRFA